MPIKTLFKIYPIVLTARALFKKKQFDVALKKAEEALEVNPHHVEMQKLKADCLREIANRELELGRDLLQMGDPEAARDVLKKIQPEWDSQAYAEAQVLLSEANRRIELGEVRRLVEKEAVAEASRLSKRGKLAEAISLLQRLPELSPETRRLLNLLNQMQEEVNQRIAGIRQALEDGEIPRAQEMFDDVRGKVGVVPDLVALEEEIRTARLMERYEQAEQLANQHRYDDAVDIIDTARKEGLGYFYDAVEEIIDKHREHHLSEGMAAVELKTPDGLQKAREHLEQAKRFTPEHEAVTELAQAITRWEVELERQKKRTAGEYVQRGEEHRKAEPPDFERALIYYDLALEIDRNNREARRLRDSASGNVKQIQESWQKAQQEFDKQEYDNARRTLSRVNARRYHHEKEILLAEIEALEQQAEEIIERAKTSVNPREGLRLLKEELPLIWQNRRLPVGLKRTLENKVGCLEMVESAEIDHAAGDVAKAIKTLREAIRKASLISSWEPENADELLEQYEKEYVEDAEKQIQNLYDACKFSDALEKTKEGFELFRSHSTDRRKPFQDWQAKIESARKEMEELCKRVREEIGGADFTNAQKILRDLCDAYPDNPHADELEAEIEKSETAYESKILADGHCATRRHLA